MTDAELTAMEKRADLLMQTAQYPMLVLDVCDDVKALVAEVRLINVNRRLAALVEDE